MLRVLGMLGGIAIGAVAGLLGGGLVGGLAGLITLAFANQSTALSVGIGVGGAMAMLVAVVAGVWAGLPGDFGPGSPQAIRFRLVDCQPLDVPGSGHLLARIHFLFL